MTTVTAASLRQETLDADISAVLDTVRAGLEFSKSLNSPHEGFAFIRAALDRLWSTVLDDGYRPVERKRHCIDLTVAAIRYVVHLTPFHPNHGGELATSLAINWVHAEVKKAMTKHRPMASIHEAYGVILEEVDELFEEVRPDRGRQLAAQKEALQVAAMGVRAILDVVGMGPWNR